MSRLGEGSLPECEALPGAHGIDERLPAIFMVEPAVAGLVAPLSVPLRRPRLSQLSEQGIVRHRHSRPFDYDVESAVPSITTGRQHHVRIDLEVNGLLLGLTGREVDRVVDPDRDEWRDMRSAV